MLMKKTLILLLSISVAFAGCGDDESDPFPFERQAELLAGRNGASKSWIIESVTVNGNALVMEPCDADNVFTFYNNDLQEYKLTSGASQCDDTHPVLMEEGSWMFTTDGKMLMISASKIFKINVMNYFGSVTSKPGQVVTLTDTSFIMEINVVDGANGQSVNTVIAFTAS
jgi:hypothetical protein